MNKSISNLAGTNSVLDLVKLLYTFGGSYTTTTSTGCETTKNSPGGQADCKDGEAKDPSTDSCKGIELNDNPFDLEFQPFDFIDNVNYMEIVNVENNAI